MLYIYSKGSTATSLETNRFVISPQFGIYCAFIDFFKVYFKNVIYNVSSKPACTNVRSFTFLTYSGIAAWISNCGSVFYPVG